MRQSYVQLRTFSAIGVTRQCLLKQIFEESSLEDEDVFLCYSALSRVSRNSSVAFKEIDTTTCMKVFSLLSNSVSKKDRFKISDSGSITASSKIMSCHWRWYAVVSTDVFSPTKLMTFSTLLMIEEFITLWWSSMLVRMVSVTKRFYFVLSWGKLKKNSQTYIPKTKRLVDSTYSRHSSFLVKPENQVSNKPLSF